MSALPVAGPGTPLTAAIVHATYESQATAFKPRPVILSGSRSTNTVTAVDVIRSLDSVTDVKQTPVVLIRHPAEPKFIELAATMSFELKSRNPNLVQLINVTASATIEVFEEFQPFALTLLSDRIPAWVASALKGSLPPVADLVIKATACTKQAHDVLKANEGQIRDILCLYLRDSGHLRDDETSPLPLARKADEHVQPLRFPQVRSSASGLPELEDPRCEGGAHVKFEFIDRVTGLPAASISSASVRACTVTVLEHSEMSTGDLSVSDDATLWQLECFFSLYKLRISSHNTAAVIALTTAKRLQAAHEALTRSHNVEERIATGALATFRPFVSPSWFSTQRNDLMNTGPAGSGKTRLARLIGQQVGASVLLDHDVTYFRRRFVGEGEDMLSGLASYASRRPWAIHVIILDELHELAEDSTSAGGAGSGSPDYKTAILTRLLHIMSAPEYRNIVFIGCTNHSLSLDGALVRPGRLSNKIVVSTLSRKVRAQLLRTDFGAGLRSAVNDIGALLRATTGFTHAQMAHVMTQSAAAEPPLDYAATSELLEKTAAACTNTHRHALLSCSCERIDLFNLGKTDFERAKQLLINLRSGFVISDRGTSANLGDLYAGSAHQTMPPVRLAKAFLEFMVDHRAVNHVRCIDMEFWTTNRKKFEEGLQEVLSECRAAKVAGEEVILLIDMDAIVGLILSSLTLSRNVDQKDQTSRSSAIAAGSQDGTTGSVQASVADMSGRSGGITVSSGDAYTTKVGGEKEPAQYQESLQRQFGSQQSTTTTVARSLQQSRLTTLSKTLTDTFTRIEGASEGTSRAYQVTRTAETVAVLSLLRELSLPRPDDPMVVILMEHADEPFVSFFCSFTRFGMLL